MMHPSYLGWQMDWPLYVKAPMLNIQGRVYKKGDYFPWAEVNADPERIATMYKNGMLYHNQDKAVEDGLGDRLGEMSGNRLKALVTLLNSELKKKHCATEDEFKRKRCRVSTIADTQRRFIRQFLAKNPYMNDFFHSVRDQFIVQVLEDTKE